MSTGGFANISFPSDYHALKVCSLYDTLHDTIFGKLHLMDPSFFIHFWYQCLVNTLTNVVIIDLVANLVEGSSLPSCVWRCMASRADLKTLYDLEEYHTPGCDRYMRDLPDWS
jgi:hypothetical protein